MKEEERSAEYLKTILSEYVILIDLSVAVNQGFETFYRHVCELSVSKNTKIFISKSEWEKLKKLSQEAEIKETEFAQKGVELLNRLASMKLAYLIEGGMAFQNIFDKLINTVKICIITQKQDIADSVSNDMSLKKFEEYRIHRLNKYGYISLYKGNEKTVYQYKKEKKLEVAKKIIELDNKIIDVFRIPKEGDVIYVNGNVEKKIGNVVEYVSDGVIYDIGGGQYAKIYRREKIDIYHREKCSLMVKSKINSRGICWPLQLIYDKKHIFIGYTFQKYEGESITISVFKKAGLEKNFPDWEKADVVQLAITILRNIEELHRNNVLIGCPELSSIKVVNPLSVFFTETDKYQIDGFPCLLRNNIFIPPERLDYIDYKFLFNEYTENYIIAVLTFMILMPGKTPYARRSGGNSIKSIKNMQFPYAFKENHSKGVPNGFWRFVWSHLPYDIKEAFYQTFQKDEIRNKPKQRPDLKFWINKLSQYNKALLSGEYCKNDKYSALLFPDTFRKSKNCVYKLCSCCGKEYPEWFMDNEFNYICKRCCEKRSDSYFVCKCCGRTFYYNIKHELLHQIKEWKPQKYCSECKKYRLNRSER